MYGYRVAVVALVAAVGCGKGSGSSSAEPASIDAPKPSSDGAVAAHGTHIYWIAGTTGRPNNLVRRFDTASKTWESIAPVTQSRLNLAAATAGDRIVAAGGMTGISKYSDVVESYDPATHTWTRTATLPTAVSSPAAAAVGDTLYVFGGTELLDPRLESYDAASVSMAVAVTGKTVKSLAPMPTAREEACAVAVGGKVYVLGGRISRSGEDTAVPPSTDAVEIYDTSTDAWTDGPPMPRSATGYAAVLGGEVVFFGGGPMDTDQPMILDVAAGEWRMGAARDNDTVGDTVEGAVVIGDTLYVVTQILRGFSEPSIPHVYSYDPAADSWAKQY